MPKVKISEYSATANSNTDVASINIDEGCAPSGINNAIRAVMGHLKDFQQGTNGDPFNGPMNGTLGATTASTANVTTLTTSSTITHNGGTANGVAYLNGSKVLTTGSALVFDGTNLGIGTTSPASPLHITSSIAPTSGSIVRIDGTATTIYSGTGYVGGQIRINFTNATSRYAGINFSNTGATSQDFFGAVQNASGYNDFVWQGFSGSYLERMRLDSSGNFGLGVTPSAWSALKAIQLPNAISLASFSGGATPNAYLSTNIYFDGSNWIFNASYGASRYEQVSGQHQWFGIGTGTANATATLPQLMTLDASGNLLVGVTSAIASGSVIQNLGGSRQVLTLKGDTFGSYTLGVWNASTSGDALFAYFGTETSLSVRGAISYNRTGGLTVYGSTSDYRAKTVNGSIQNALSKVALLKPSTGRMNGAEQDIDFFVAHELQEIVPSAVTGQKDDVKEDGSPKYQMVDKSALIPLLTAAMQELKAEFDAYKASHP